jgi:hypothetical protein
MTVAAQIARELGVSASYAQRTLRQVKADLARQATTRPDGRATTDQPTEQATSDHDRQEADRSQDEQAPATEREDEATTAERSDQPTVPERGDQATTTDRDDHATTWATTNGDGRPAGDAQRHLSLVSDREADRGEVPSR